MQSLHRQMLRRALARGVAYQFAAAQVHQAGEAQPAIVGRDIRAGRSSFEFVAALDFTFCLLRNPSVLPQPASAMNA